MSAPFPRPTRPRTIGAVLTLGVLGALGVLSGCGDDGAIPGGGGSGGAPASTATTSTSTASTSTASTSTGGGGGASCGPSPGFPSTPACDACVADACCDESAACAAEPRCAAIMDCYDRCADDPACLEACPVDVNQPTPTTLQLITCQLEHCRGECGLDTGVACEHLASAPEAADPAGCEACIEEQCCDAYQPTQTPEYAGWRSCLLACDEPACVAACEAAHAEGAAVDDGIRACVFGTCKTTCQRPGWCGEFQFGGGACEDCALPACCAVHEACTFDSGCLDFIRLCWSTCSGEEACRECLSLWSADDVGLAFATMACLDLSCGDACGTLLGQPLDGCGLLAGTEPPLCEDCLEASCCAEAGACWTDPACAAIEVCRHRCDGDPACEAACADDHPAGGDAHAALLACRGASCGDECSP